MFRTLIAFGAICFSISAGADCLSKGAVARRAVAYINQDSEVPDCLLDISPEQRKIEMSRIVKSIEEIYEGYRAHELLTGYLVMVCEFPYNAPDTPEEDWTYGYQTTLTFSCSGEIRKDVDSND